jgi:pimeloyl-ACP methyl ester carboxylesterase
VAPDLRGYNETDRPEGIEAYRISVVVKDILALIEALGETRAIVCGHDWGGVVAWRLAIQHPQAVERLIVLNAPHPLRFLEAFQGGHLPQLRRSWYMFFFQLPGVAERLLEADRFRLLWELTFRGWGSRRFPTTRELTVYVEAMARPGALTAALNWYRAQFARMRLDRATPGDFPKVQAPTLMIWGEKDGALGKELSKGTAGLVAGRFRRVYLPQAGHFVHQESPNQVNALILDFLRDLAPRPRRARSARRRAQGRRSRVQR